MPHTVFPVSFMQDGAPAGGAGPKKAYTAKTVVKLVGWKDPDGTAREKLRSSMVALEQIEPYLPRHGHQVP